MPLGTDGVRRRLAIRPGAIGDLIVSLPALECLRAEYLEVWVAEANVPLIRFAQAAHSIGSTGLDLLEIHPPAGLVDRLRSFDSIVSWDGASRPEFREAVERFGLPIQFFPALPAGRKIHAVDFYLEQIAGAGILACGERPRRPSLDLPGCRGSGKPADFAVIHPFASSPAKRWPLDKFR